MFHVGQNVVCIRGNGFGLKKGHIYTVSALEPPAYSKYTGRVDIGLRLLEARPRPGCSAFCASRFRPVKQTSIEIFRQLLVSPPKSPVREDA